MKLLLVVVVCLMVRKVHGICRSYEVKAAETITQRSYSKSYRYLYTYQNVLHRFVLCEKEILERGKTIQITNQGTRNYKYITFVDSVIPVVPAGVFNSVTNLSEIYLNGSHIKTLDPGAFGGIVGLQGLHLEDNKINVIAEGIFNSLTYLKTLNLANNNIITLEGTALHGLKSLENLTFCKNNLHNFTVSSLRALRYLDISYNNISMIDSVLNLFNLEELLLHHNRLNTLPPLLFKRTNVLKFLDISYNRFTSIDFSILPSSLNCLNISNNFVNIMHKWSHLQGIETVDLSNNLISTIANIGKGITYMNMGRNKLRNLPSLVFSRSESLRKLDLSSNLIAQINHNSFGGLSQLEFLSLENNQIEYLPIGCFKELVSLKELLLSNNLLQDFDFGTFAGLRKLETLSLHNNRLRYIQENSFYVVEMLRKLTLNNNEINSLSADDLLIHLNKLEEIDLDNNNWSCNSLLTVMKSFNDKGLNVIKGNDYNVTNVDGIACVSERITKEESAHIGVDVTTSRSFDTENKREDLSKVCNLNCFSHNDTFSNVLEKAFKNSSFYKYFEKDFVHSSFYNFFGTDYTNTGFLKYFQDDFKNSSFVKYFESEFSYNNCKNRFQESQSFANETPVPSSLIRGTEGLADKILFLVAIILLVINIAMLSILMYCLNTKGKFKTAEIGHSNFDEAALELT